MLSRWTLPLTLAWESAGAGLTNWRQPSMAVHRAGRTTAVTDSHARAKVHALFADSQCVWAWDPCDPHANARQFRNVEDWITRHPGSAMRLWVSAELQHSVELAEAPADGNTSGLRAMARAELARQFGAPAMDWALAIWSDCSTPGACALSGIDMKALQSHALRHDVQMQAVAPWWNHALDEAKRCVHALNHAEHSQICVVEGRNVAWIDVRRGTLGAVPQRRIAEPNVDALRTQIGALQNAAVQPPTVVVGHGLCDGASPRGLSALVLGRLDGIQPPQWLRPSSVHEVH